MPNTEEKQVDVAILLSIVTGYLMRDGLARESAETVAWIINKNNVPVEYWQQEAGLHLALSHDSLWDFKVQHGHNITRQNYQSLLADFRSQHGDTLLITPMPLTEQSS
jgi:hypothetical protein